MSSVVTNAFFWDNTMQRTQSQCIFLLLSKLMWALVSGFPIPKTCCFPSLRLVQFCRIKYKFIQEGLALLLHGSGTYYGTHI